MGLTFIDIVFYKLSVGLIGAACVAIFSRKPIYGAVSFLMLFIQAAFLFMMIEAEFLGFLFLIVYGGAFFLLSLFSLFMVRPSVTPEKPSWIYKSICWAAAGLLLAELIFLLTVKVQPFIWHTSLFAPTGDPERMRHLGKGLYEEYAVVVSLTGFLLLTTIVGATVLMGKRKSKMLHQSLREQLRTPAEVELQGGEAAGPPP